MTIIIEFYNDWNLFSGNRASIPCILDGSTFGTSNDTLLVWATNRNSNNTVRLSMDSTNLYYNYYESGAPTPSISKSLPWDLVTIIYGSAITRNISGQNYYDFGLEINTIYLFIVFDYNTFIQAIPTAGVYIVVTESKGSSIADANNRIGFSLLSNATPTNPLTSITCIDLSNYRFRFTLTSGVNNIGILHKIGNFS